MKLRTLWFTGVLTLSIATTSAQTDTIAVNGQVCCAAKPMEACIVTMLHPADSSIIAYAMTDGQGHYTMNTSTHLKELLVRVTGFNVKRLTKRVTARSQTLNFDVEEENIVLREVQVKAQKLWGNRDTLNYLVSAYTKEHDRTIGDVLRQLPGITIEDNGTIKYQGTPINHFYIENLDMLQGRYNLATEGIKAEDVTMVQVLENHEHVKALQDQTLPESAAINLKLKKEAKGVWTKSADIGAGVYGDGILWNATLQTMYFGKGGQHLLRYSGNDNGSGLESSISHYGPAIGEGTSLFGIIGHGASPVGNSFFGFHHGANLNNLTKLSDDATLHYNLNYYHHFSRGSSISQTTYILPDGSHLLLTEDIADRTHTDGADLQLTYEKNTKQQFLNNTLSLSGKWNEGRGTVFSEGQFRQSLHYRSLALANQTRWVHRTDKGGGFEWISTNSFGNTPQKLSVGDDMTAQQEANLYTLSTSNRFESLHNLRTHRWSLSVSGHANANYTILESTLNHPDNPIAPSGDMRHLHIQVGAGPTLCYACNSFNASLHIPAALTYTQLMNDHGSSITPEQTTDDHTRRLHFRLQPSFSLQWKAGNRISFNAAANYTATETPWQQLFTATLMSNYRSISRYRATLADTYKAGANLKVSYKNLFSGLFAHINGTWNRSWSDIAFGATLDEQAHSVIEAAETPNHNQSFSLTAYGRKDIDWHTTQLEFTATVRKGESELLRQSALSTYHTTGYDLCGTLAFDIVQGHRLEYRFSWNLYNSSSSGYRYNYSEWSQHAKLNLRLLPSRLFLRLTANHTHNGSLVSSRKDYVFFGSGLQFKLSKKVEFNLDADNLTNLHRYTTRSVSDMEQHYTVYELRPWSIMLMMHITL
ncbi:MAG: hypothetical protein NC206_09170 [Bacteroides sp.]|nr:hypothetical protein [Roseburia sp.]MCM1347241.1 hypothetical protein [Bacteroides sp.]MCM1421742.1 hypothetical protein [Bacteroides sp.]